MNPQFAVSTWALHKTIGAARWESPTDLEPAFAPVGESAPLDLLQLPAALAAHGFTAMQLCHFHLPTTDEAYLAQFRQALSDAGVTLHALLIDNGDITDPENGARDAEWIAKWLGVAKLLGAQRARVIAGKQKTSPEALALAIERLKVLVDVADPVKIEIENWFDLLATPEAVFTLLDGLDGKVGLCADWGNWPRPFKYENLPTILPRASTCHAKLDFVAEGVLDEVDAKAMIDMTRAAGFTGHYVLVSGGPSGSEWDALRIQREAIQ